MCFNNSFFKKLHTHQCGGSFYHTVSAEAIFHDNKQEKLPITLGQKENQEASIWKQKFEIIKTKKKLL